MGHRLTLPARRRVGLLSATNGHLTPWSSEPRHQSQHAEMHKDGEEADGAQGSNINSDQKSLCPTIVIAVEYGAHNRNEEDYQAQKSGYEMEGRHHAS